MRVVVGQGHAGDDREDVPGIGGDVLKVPAFEIVALAEVTLKYFGVEEAGHGGSISCSHACEGG